MDTETKTQEADLAASPSQEPASAPACKPKPDMISLLEQTSLPRPVCQWIQCLRAPAMSLRYDVEERHMPDRDATDSNSPNADAPCTMHCTGQCTVRYFDLAVGAMAMIAIGCLLKCCMGCCGYVKRKFH